MKKLAAVLAVALVAFGWAAVHLWQELGAQRQRNLALATDAAAQAVPVVGVGLQGGNAPAAPGATQVASADSGNGAAGRAGPAAAASSAAATAAPPAVRNSPAAAMLRASLEQQFPDVAAALGLTPEEVERLFDLLARQRTDLGTDRLQMMSQGGDGAAREAAAARIAQKEQAYEGELDALLGGKYMQWKDYERGANRRQVEEMERQAMEELRQAVSPPGRRMDDQRLQALNTALEAEQRKLDRARPGESVQQRA